MLKKAIPTLIFSLFAVTAFANAPAFGDLDTNKDGALSKGEAATAGISKELFGKADTDMNGMLSEKEYGSIVTGDK